MKTNDLDALRRVDPAAGTPDGPLTEPELAALSRLRTRAVAEQQVRPFNACATEAGRRQPVRQRRLLGVVAAAVAVLGLVTTGFFVTTSTQGGSAEARTGLDAAASHTVISKDPTVLPGQYLHQVIRNWGEARVDAGGRQMRVLLESVNEVWIPSTWNQEWILRRTETGRHQWVDGSDQEAKDQGLTFPKSSRTDSGKCAAFFDAAGCDRAGSWQDPTPAWMASLPRDPEALYQRLKKDAPRNGRGDTELLVFAADALRTGRLTAELRAALYRTLGHLDGLRVSDHAANLDGRTGIAYGSDDGEFREELIVDPATGAFIGSRTVDTDGKDRGQITGWTSATSKVVDEPPAR